jgi:hypothetical protein
MSKNGMDNLLINKVPVFVHFPGYDKKKELLRQLIVRKPSRRYLAMQSEMLLLRWFSRNFHYKYLDMN